MALLLSTSQPSFFTNKTFTTNNNNNTTTTTHTHSFSNKFYTKPLLFTKPIRTQKPLHSSLSDDSPEPPRITDEWGDPASPGPEPEPGYPRASDADPPRNEDEWEVEDDIEKYEAVAGGNGNVVEEERGGGGKGGGGRIEELKRCLVDSIYGTELGYRASGEVRAEILEVVTQLEGLNPTPSPVDTPSLLRGNWVLLYTAFSELLPLLAAGSLPLLKVKKISQGIDTSNLSIVNSVVLSSPFATFSFSASATFEVCSPSRIQVQFKESSFDPPELKIDFPENLNIFGQNINLAPIQQSLGPLQDALTNISRTISGRPPLKVPIPGNRPGSFLLITYLDEDLRISRGDGGLFVLAKEGSPFLDQ